jgi:hypothetical protein
MGATLGQELAAASAAAYRLERDNARLRVALTPFASANKMSVDYNDLQGALAHITIQNLRDAHAALEQ